jgi:hypothetical protein
MALESLPHAEDDTPAIGQNPPHLAHGRSSIRKKLQALLTQHEIERVVLQAEGDRIPFPPLNRCAFRRGQRAGYGQHLCTYVERCYLAFRSNHGRDVSSHNAGAACDIQHVLAKLRGRVFKQYACERARKLQGQDTSRKLRLDLDFAAGPRGPPH